MKGTEKFPLLPLRGMVVFPSMIIHLDAGRPRSIGAIEQAMLADRRILLVAQKNAEIEEPKPEDLFTMGTVAEVRQIFKLPGGAFRVLVEGIERARIRSVRALEKYDEAEAICLRDAMAPSMELEALTRGVVHQFEEWVKVTRKIPAEALVSVSIIDDSGRLADLISSHLNLSLEDKQALLDLDDVGDRMRKLYAILVHELEVLAIERKLGSEVRQQMEKLQRDYYLREKIKVIQKELGDQDDRQAAIEEYKTALKKKKCPDTVRKTIEKEIRRLEGMSGYSAETGVVRTYLDCLLSLPWEEATKETVEIKKSRAYSGARSLRTEESQRTYFGLSGCLSTGVQEKQGQKNRNGAKSADSLFRGPSRRRKDFFGLVNRACCRPQVCAGFFGRNTRRG